MVIALEMRDWWQSPLQPMKAERKINNPPRRSSHKEMGCPKSRADPNSSRKCRHWHNSKISVVSRHVRKDATPEQLVQIRELSTSKLRPDERWYQYYLIFGGRLQREQIDSRWTYNQEEDDELSDSIRPVPSPTDPWCIAPGERTTDHILDPFITDGALGGPSWPSNVLGNDMLLANHLLEGTESFVGPHDCNSTANDPSLGLHIPADVEIWNILSSPVQPELQASSFPAPFYPPQRCYPEDVALQNQTTSHSRPLVPETPATLVRPWGN